MFSESMTKEDFIDFLASASQSTIDELAFKSTIKKDYIYFLKLLLFKRLINNPKNRIGQSLIHTSVIHNNIDAISLLLDSGLNVNEVDDDLRTPLHLAMMPQINPEIISILINNEADINALTERLETPIFLACQCNNSKAVELLLATKKCDISYPNDLGQEPLFFAYKNNNKQILRLFKDYKEEK